MHPHWSSILIKAFIGVYLLLDEIKSLLTDGHTKLLKGFKSKQGKSFDAVVAFDGDYNTVFVFPERKSKATSAKRRK